MLAATSAQEADTVTLYERLHPQPAPKPPVPAWVARAQARELPARVSTPSASAR